MKYVMDTSKLTSRECRDRAAGLLAQAEEYEVTGEREALCVAKAQVWATLALVPEPLEEVHGQLIGPPSSLSARFPTLVCPHGMQAQLVPMDTEEIDGIDFPTGLRYTWQPDCTQGCP